MQQDFKTLIIRLHHQQKYTGSLTEGPKYTFAFAPGVASPHICHNNHIKNINVKKRRQTDRETDTRLCYVCNKHSQMTCSWHGESLHCHRHRSAGTACWARHLLPTSHPSPRPSSAPPEHPSCDGSDSTMGTCAQHHQMTDLNITDRLLSTQFYDYLKIAVSSRNWQTLIKYVGKSSDLIMYRINAMSRQSSG